MKSGRVLTATTALALLLCGSAGATEWRVPGRFPTLQAAIDSSLVKDGDVLRVLPGRRTGATVTKAVVLRALGCVTIVDGPAVNDLGKAGFLFPGGGAGSGATVDGFTFEGVAFPVFSRGADDVSVTHNTMLPPPPGRVELGERDLGPGLGHHPQHHPRPAHELRRRHRHPDRRLQGRRRHRQRHRPQRGPRPGARARRTTAAATARRASCSSPTGATASTGARIRATASRRTACPSRAAGPRSSPWPACSSATRAMSRPS